MTKSYSRFLGVAGVLLATTGSVRAQVANDTIPVDKHQYKLFNPTPRKYMRPLVPDRPGITDSPYTVDAGHFQLEDDGFRLINGRQRGSHEREFYVNHMLLKLGLTDKTDVQLQVESYIVDKQWQDSGNDSPLRQAGFGDLTLRVKRNIVGDDNKPFALAVLGLVRMPTGHNVGEGGTELGLSVPVVYKLPHHWNVGGQVAGVWSYDRETSSHYSQLTPTLTVDREFAKWLEGFVELVGYWDMRGAAWRTSVNLGPQFDIGDNLQIDFGTHIALDRQTDHEYFIGFSFRR
ncbi:transporter [Hymenobacter crusticola]|uniref:Transporter n=1 Tax=Hymenobacter crusticola TaxID=1770526 RepID=A0A243WH20_9BACT|nr:transporter [Hymenobacter crusticola]OUJ75099.1 hypothetical protein BXP70_03475 [Hymenobacter crusticola]